MLAPNHPKESLHVPGRPARSALKWAVPLAAARRSDHASLFPVLGVLGCFSELPAWRILPVLTPVIHQARPHERRPVIITEVVIK